MISKFSLCTGKYRELRGTTCFLRLRVCGGVLTTSYCWSGEDVGFLNGYTDFK